MTPEQLTKLREEWHTQFDEQAIPVVAEFRDMATEFWLPKVTAAYLLGRSEVKAEIVKTPAFENLAQYQGQLDEDGVCVAVSRQALDEVMNALTITQLTEKQ